MPRDHLYWVYIVASRSRTLYIGVTNDLTRRVAAQHRASRPGSFTARYNIHRLVFFERFERIETAIAREKTIKGWLRSRKLALIEGHNPTWEDLLSLTHPNCHPERSEGPASPPLHPTHPNCHPERSEGPASPPQTPTSSNPH